MIYWKVAALLARVPGGAKRKTSGISSAGERQTQRSSWDQRHSGNSCIFYFPFESFLETFLRVFFRNL